MPASYLYRIQIVIPISEKNIIPTIQIDIFYCKRFFLNLMWSILSAILSYKC